jgi:hypothetical protein
MAEITSVGTFSLYFITLYVRFGILPRNSLTIKDLCPTLVRIFEAWVVGPRTHITRNIHILFNQFINIKVPGIVIERMRLFSERHQSISWISRNIPLTIITNLDKPIAAIVGPTFVFAHDNIAQQKKSRPFFHGEKHAI